MKHCDYNILSTYVLISSKARRFPRKKVIEFQHCGNMWELCNLCHASFYKYHHSRFPLAEHDINSRRVI